MASKGPQSVFATAMYGFDLHPFPGDEVEDIPNTQTFFDVHGYRLPWPKPHPQDTAKPSPVSLRHPIIRAVRFEDKVKEYFAMAKSHVPRPVTAEDLNYDNFRPYVPEQPSLYQPAVATIPLPPPPMQSLGEGSSKRKAIMIDDEDENVMIEDTPSGSVKAELKGAHNPDTSMGPPPLPPKKGQLRTSPFLGMLRQSTMNMR